MGRTPKIAGKCELCETLHSCVLFRAEARASNGRKWKSGDHFLNLCLPCFREQLEKFMALGRGLQ
jgi:hypothetical protein